MKALVLGVLGATGRMGKLLVEAGKQNASFSDVKASASRQCRDVFEQADVVIDFSVPEATLGHLQAAQTLRKPLLVGTTGIFPSVVQEFEEVAKNIPLMWAPNTSRSMVVFKQAVALVAERLGQGYDVEIVETHHRGKRDKPSGTALVLQGVIAKGSDEIPITSLRMGQLSGEHTVYWVGEGDALTFSHRAFDRSGFVKGALEAAVWLAQQGPGRYSIESAFRA